MSLKEIKEISDRQTDKITSEICLPFGYKTVIDQIKITSYKLYDFASKKQQKNKYYSTHSFHVCYFCDKHN